MHMYGRRVYYYYYCKIACLPACLHIIIYIWEEARHLHFPPILDIWYHMNARESNKHIDKPASL